MFVTEDIKYVGVYDNKIDLFEGQYKVPDGILYNSYVIIDEKIAVLDTADKNWTEEWLGNVKNALAGRKPDYLIVQHMEPDHSASIKVFAEMYPDVKIVASKPAFFMMQNFFGTNFAEKQVIVTDGDELSLGKHKLTFLTAQMVHWPEVIVTYDSYDKVLFSADGFGTFGKETDDWSIEARRYYIGIVGKYGEQVISLLEKAGGLDIKIICPLHGPVLKENLAYYLNLYKIWASYEAQVDGILIVYTSVYGNTKNAALKLFEKLKARGVENIKIFDLARCDIHEAVSYAFCFSKLVLATTTYNGDIFPFMREFIENLTERNFKKRTISLIENGTWAPLAAKVMKSMLEKCEDISYTQNSVKILSALNENSEKMLDSLADELIK